MRTTLFTFLTGLCLAYCSIAQTNSRYYTDSIYSQYLGEYRKMNIYLPPGFTTGQDLPVIFATDGFPMTSEYKHLTYEAVDSLVRNGLIQPIILVESHFNDAQADSYTTSNGQGHFMRRNYEYAEVNARGSADSVLSGLFDKHLDYFSVELVAAIKERLGVSCKAENCWFFGFSNGAAFGISMMNRRPTVLGHYLCFSSIGFGAEQLIWKSDVDYPEIVMNCGDQEDEYFNNEVQTTITALDKIGVKNEYYLFKGGHSRICWKRELAALLVRRFPSI